MNKDEALLLLAKDTAKKKFWSFCLYLNHDFFMPRVNILKPIADALEKGWYSDKEHYKLAISLFPRAGKSTLINYFIAWSIGKDMHRAILRASYSFDLSKELNQSARMLLDEEKYIQIFGTFETVENTAQKIRFKDTHRATLYASSVGGATTGFGGSIIISDDLYKDHIEAFSDTINSKTKTWYQSAFKSRMDGKRKFEIIVGTRWRIGELVDDLENENYFDEVIKVPALINNKSICEHVISTKYLLEEQRLMPAVLFYSMYQQQPTEASNGVVSPNEIRYVTEEYNVLTRLCVIDNKTTGKDFFAITMVAIAMYKGNIEVIIEDTIFTQDILTDTLEDRIANFVNYYSPQYTFIETNKDYSLKRNLKKKINGTVVGFNTTMNKESKILVEAKHMKRFMRIQTQDREYLGFWSQVFSYDLDTKNKHDDAIDNLAMVVQKIRQNKNKLGASEWLL